MGAWYDDGLAIGAVRVLRGAGYFAELMGWTPPVTCPASWLSLAIIPSGLRIKHLGLSVVSIPSGPESLNFSRYSSIAEVSRNIARVPAGRMSLDTLGHTLGMGSGEIVA